MNSILPYTACSLPFFSLSFLLHPFLFSSLSPFFSASHSLHPLPFLLLFWHFFVCQSTIASLHFIFFVCLLVFLFIYCHNLKIPLLHKFLAHHPFNEFPASFSQDGFHHLDVTDILSTVYMGFNQLFWVTQSIFYPFTWHSFKYCSNIVIFILWFSCSQKNNMNLLNCYMPNFHFNLIFKDMFHTSKPIKLYFYSSTLTKEYHLNFALMTNV